MTLLHLPIYLSTVHVHTHTLWGIVSVPTILAFSIKVNWSTTTVENDVREFACLRIHIYIRKWLTFIAATTKYTCRHMCAVSEVM